MIRIGLGVTFALLLLSCSGGTKIHRNGSLSAVASCLCKNGDQRDTVEVTTDSCGSVAESDCNRACRQILGSGATGKVQSCSDG